MRQTIILLFSVQSLVICVFAAYKGTYNDPCQVYDEVFSCNSTKGLQCMDVGLKGHRCKCPIGAAKFQMTFDPVRDRCVGKAYNACVRGQFAKVNESYCVDNAHCNDTRYYIPLCICNPGFVEADNGSCVLGAGFEESCATDGPSCDREIGLKCENGKCQCAMPNSVYSKEEGRCISMVDGACQRQEDCTPNALCSQSSIFKPEQMDSKGQRGVRTNDDPIVFAQETPRDKRFDGIHGLFGSHFNIFRDEPFPEEFGIDLFKKGFKIGAHISKKGNGSKKCTCAPGYRSTNSGQCLASLGTFCHGTEGKQECNPEQHLACVESSDRCFRCGCSNPLHQRYDPSRKSCVSIIGGKCQSSNSSVPCEAGSSCIDGICKCDKGTSMTPLGTCMKNFDEKCMPGDCNRFSGLVCHPGSSKCKCIDSNLEFDKSTDSCLAVGKGAICGPVKHQKLRTRNILEAAILVDTQYSDIFIKCTDNLTCSPTTESSSFHRCA